MVVFSCDGCGEVLKKNQVDAHAGRCRRCFSVSCADCLVSFPDDEYRTHTSCLTEVERYEKRGSAGKQNKNQKLTPQQHWMDLLASSVESCPPHLTQHLETMASLDNVPRKEKQFRNFASNSLKLHKHDSDRLLSEIWKFLMDLKEQQRQEQQQDKDQQQPTKDGDKKEEAKKVDEQTTEEKDDPSPDTIPASTEDALNAKAVKKAMKRVLKQSKDHSLSVKQLRKAVKKELCLVKEGKERLKELINANASKKTFSCDGKVIRLQAS